MIHGAQGADPFVGGKELVTKLLKTMKRFHFPLGLAQEHERIKSLGDRFALNLSGETEVGSMARIVGPGTMTGGLATFAGGGGDGTAAEIAQISDLAK